MSKSVFYYNIKALQKDKHVETKQQILDIYNKNNGRYGYRRITIVLRNSGYIINHKTVLRLMRQLKIAGIRHKRRKYSSYMGSVGKIAPNIINRNFSVTSPMEKLFTDVTEFKINDTKVYLSPIVDSYNGEVVAYDISLRPDFMQTTRMLNELYKNHEVKQGITILHSDQGWQYQMRQYQDNLAQHGIIQSMSRKGNCLDNAIAEGFFGKLKTEFYYCNTFDSVETFIRQLKEYINYYNKNRIKATLNGLSPVDYRLSNAA